MEQFIDGIWRYARIGARYTLPRPVRHHLLMTYFSYLRFKSRPLTVRRFALGMPRYTMVSLRYVLPRPIRQGIAHAHFNYLKVRSRVASQVVKRLGDLIIASGLQKKVHALPLLRALQPYLNTYLAIRLLRDSELGAPEAYEHALALLQGCKPATLASLPEYALQQALECLATYGEHDLIVSIASQFRRAPHGVYPGPAILVSAACVAVREEALVAPLLAAIVEDPRKANEIGRLAGVYEVRTLFPPHWSRHDPQGTVGFTDPWIMGEPSEKRTVLPLPYEGCASLDNACIIGGFNVIDAEGCLVVYDYAGHPSLPHVAGLRNQVRGTALAMNRAVVICPYRRRANLASAILIGGRIESNYFHWIVEYLPRLLTAIEGGATNDIPLLIPAGMPQSMRRALEIINQEAFPVYEYEPDTLLEVDRLFIPSMHSCIVDGLALPLSRIGVLSPRHLQFVRERILQHVAKLDREVAAPTHDSPDKILLLRGRRARAVTSELVIQSELMKQGFVAVDPVALSFEDQVRLFRDAKVIVAASGAALTNLLFCSKDPAVFSLIAGHNVEFSLFANLLQIAGRGCFTHVPGKATTTARESPNAEFYVHANYEVEPDDVIKAIKTMTTGRDF